MAGGLNRTVFFFSCVVDVPLEGMRTHAFQLLPVPRKVPIVETYDVDLVVARRLWNLQPFAVVDSGVPENPTVLDCYQVGESEEFDLIHLLGNDVLARNTVKLWTRVPPAMRKAALL